MNFTLELLRDKRSFMFLTLDMNGQTVGAEGAGVRLRVVLRVRVGLAVSVIAILWFCPVLHVLVDRDVNSDQEPQDAYDGS